MAIDRRKSAAKRFEDDRKKKATAAAKKAEQEKKAAAKKAQKQNKPVRSPGKDITTSVRDTFRGQAAKPQFGTKQTAAQRMQGRSENWARLEAQKANADKSTRKKIEAEQDRLHKANRKDAKGMTFDSATGRWMGGGKPAYTPNVLPGMSRDAQRTGTERSLRNGIVAPDMQKAAKKHRDAVWDRVHGPETGERIKKMLSGAAKGYGSDMENFHGLAITGRGLGMEKEHAREIKVWEDEIRRWEKSLRDWEADGSLTNDERKELTDLIAANRKKIEMYEKQNRGTRAASQEVYQTADALGESGARDTQTAKRGLGAFGSAAIDVGTAGAQMLGDMALGGTPAMLMRGIGGGAKEARQSGASHMQQANYGMLSGAASVLTEKISNVAKPLGKAFGKGAADDLIQKGIDKAVKKLAGSAAGEKALQTIAKHGANALGEGFEESLEAALDPLLKRATYDSGAQWDLGEIIYNGIIGAGTGLVTGSGMEAAQNGIESAARGVRDRMGQPLPLPRAKPKGQETLWTKKEDTLYPQSAGLQLPETSGDGVPSTHSILQADAKNKSIDQLLSNGRPMPEAMTDDTLVAHSIAQTAGESKAGLTMEYGKPKTENSQAIGQTEKPGLTIAYGKPQAEETAIDTNPETHTPEQTSIEKPKTLNDRIKENRDLFEKNGTLFEMTGNEFAQSDKKLIDQVTEFFNSIGNKVFRKNFGEVALTRSGARDSISHGIGREKAIAFAAVPDVIEKGQVIDEQANWKGRRYDTVTFGGRIKIAGQDYDMGVIVKRYDNPAMASKYYVHEVMLANKEGEATTFKTGTEPAEPVGYPSDVTSPSTDSIPQTAGESKVKLTMEYGKPQAQETTIDMNPETHTPELPKIEVGDKVRARGLRNLGTIIGLNADGTYEVEFHNKQTGANKVVTMPAEAFETIRRKKLPPDAKSVQRAQEQQEALESDSYEIPDIVEQEERAVRAAQNAEDAKDQLEALEGPRTDAADAAYERTRATYADMVAEEALLRANRIAANHPVREAAARSSVHPMDVNAPDAAGAIEITRQLEGMRQTLGRLQHQFKLTKADLVTAEELAKGRTPTREVSPEKLEKITSYAKLLGEYKTAMQPFYEYKTQLDTSRRNAADALIRNSEKWKDAKMGVSLSAKTPERVIEAVTGNDAAEVNDALIRPVHAHNAERMRYENDHRDMLREAVKGTTREESTWVAMLNYAEYLERTGKDSSKLRVAMDKYYEKNKKHIRPARAKQLERDLIAIMDSLYPDQNETRIRNGYEPLEYMKNYLPARTRIDEGGRGAKFLRKALGIETKADELPTEIAGTTANRRPGQPYQPYAEHRVGDTDKVQIKDFDAVRAVDDYISFAGREIFFTEDIQNIRTFEERLRYRFSDEGTRAELDSLDGDYTMDPNERLKAKMEIWERDQYSLPHFPTWLRKYADMLAGKKQLTDRSAEEQTGRPLYRAVSDVETKAAVNLTGFNIATALNNLVAMQQGGSEVSAKSMARAALNYARSLTGDGDFDARSTFLTNRHGTDRVWKTNLQKVQDIGGKPMEWVDHFTAGILTRGRYYDNVRAGLNAEQAMKEADDWAARVIGDRSVGARPMLFESKNPLVKAVTMFQLEPANTISHWVHDIPRSMSVGAAVGTFAKLFLTAYLFNDTMEKITGVRPAPDPVGLINSMVGRFTGWMLPNTIDMALELVRGDLDEEDFQTEKPELGDAILETAQDVASEVPFISGPLGAAFGAGNARMPIESAMPDLVTLTKALTGEGTRESKIVTAVDELSKPALAIGLPTGGGQLRKTVRGLHAAYNSGVYGYDKEGKRELKFPLYGEGNKALQAAQAAVFGPYATGRGREYVRSGFQSSLNAKETRAYDTLRNQFGVEPSAAYDGVRAVQAVDEMSTYERGGTKKGAKRNAIMALDISADAKKYLDGCLIGTSYDIPSYENETDFAITRSVTGKMQEAALSLAHEDGLSADAVIKYVLFCKTSSSENEIENKAGQMVDICTDMIGAADLTDAQRRAVTEKLLIPQMGDKWNGEAAKTWLSGMDPTDIVYTKFRMDQIDAEVDDDATIRKLDKADHKRAKKDALIDELGLDFKAEQGLRYFLGDAKGWDWEWSDIGRDGSEDERELAWELEQTGMDVVTYEIIKAGVGRQKGVEGERYSKKKKVIAYLNEWDLPQNQKDLILKMASTYDDYKIGRGGSGKSSGRKSTGMQQPQRLKTLKPLSLPF
ncbi:MAG: hypothetical protein KH050_05830 [Clostridiaceae bacterium]|nr:hypothetical protein [Clostridiaceae bacterium]